MERNATVNDHVDPFQLKPRASSILLPVVKDTDEAAHHTVSPGFPVSVATLTQWSRYLSHCETIAKQIDWREIFAFFDVDASSPQFLVPSPTFSTSAANTSMSSDASITIPMLVPIKANVSIKHFKHAMEMDCQRRFGQVPLRLHQHCLFRWTKMLARSIVRRLEDAIQGGDPIPPDEILGYQIIFASRAGRVAGVEPIIRSLISLLETLGMQEIHNISASSTRSKLTSHSALFAPPLSLTLTMTFSSWTTSPYILSTCIPGLLAQSLNDTWTESLALPHDVLDLKKMNEKVRKGIAALVDDPKQGDHVVPDDSLWLHCAVLRPLLVGEEPAKSDREKNPLLLRLDAPTTAVLQSIKPHQVPCAARVLETAGYVMLTKIRSGCVVQCYQTLPFLSDYNALTRMLEQRPEMPSGSILSVLRLALMAAAEVLYAKHVSRFLKKYHNKAVKNVVRIESAGQVEIVSVAALAILEHVVETTLTLLGLVGPLVEEEPRGFAILTIGVMKRAIDHEMGKVEDDSNANLVSRNQCRSEHGLIMDYIEAHPLSVRLRDLSPVLAGSDV